VITRHVIVAESYLTNTGGVVDCGLPIGRYKVFAIRTNLSEGLQKGSLPEKAVYLKVN
jgi:hypothetical protein